MPLSQFARPVRRTLRNNLKFPAMMAALSTALLAACSAQSTHSTGASPEPMLESSLVQRQLQLPEGVQAMSLQGRPLTAPEMPPEIRQQRERELEAAQIAYDRDTHNEEAIIWLGRRLAYLGRYKDAINVFSNGIAILPQNHKLLRHRGHRYITIRRFELAIDDLQRASDLIQGKPDEIEPDGQPNKLNTPTSTSHTNIYYHLGLARFLLGDFESAKRAYEQCMDHSKNDDMRVATAYWQYLTLRRLKHDDEAASILEIIQPQMDIIENASYHRLLLMFKGDLSPEQAAQATGEDLSVDVATTGYGVGMWHLLRGDNKEAHSRFRDVIENSNWAAFGHIAAEVELWRSNISHIAPVVNQ